MAYFLGIDLGGTVIKAGLYNESGDEVGVFESAAENVSPQEGFAERDMNLLWNSVCVVCRGVVHQSGILASDIKGVSFSSHGKGLYLVDKDGNPVRNGINSSDTRSLDIVKKWIEDGTADKAYPYGMQQIWTGHPVAILSWLKQHERASYDKGAHVLMVHDYIRFRMTGEIGAEVTNISGSNMYNQNTGAYDRRLLEMFGVEEYEDRLSKVVQSAEQCGTVTAKAAQELGLAEGTPVFGGFFDVVSAAIASGVIDGTALSAAAGTWTIATAIHDSIPKEDHHYIWGNYCIPGKFFVHEGSPTSASNLAWWRANLLRGVSYEEANAWVDEIQSARKKTTLFYMPYLYGSNYKVGLNASLYGLQGAHTLKDVVNAIYEGIVFSHLINQDKVLKITPSIRTIRMNGGPTRSEPWMKMFASASGLPVEISTVKQTGCKAAAICAAVGAGFFKDFLEANQAVLKPMSVIEPDKEQHDYLRERYEQFLEINSHMV